VFGGPQFGLLGCDSGVDGSFLKIFRAWRPRWRRFRMQAQVQVQVAILVPWLFGRIGSPIELFLMLSNEAVLLKPETKFFGMLLVDLINDQKS
jgi:hypothetical protein